MATTSVPKTTVQPPDTVPERMRLAEEWDDGDDRFELYTDTRDGEGILLLLPLDQPPERAARVYRAEGGPAVIWDGDRTQAWRDVQRDLIRSVLPSWWGER